MLSDRNPTLLSITAFLAFVSGVATSAPAESQQDPPRQSSIQFAEYQVGMDHTFELIERLQAGVERSNFDLDDKINRLDYEAETIIDFVSSEIAYQHYPGVLRGARGTLMSRAGNAIDQSLLLATMLRDAGFDARIVKAELDPPHVDMLVGVLGMPIRGGFSDQEIDALLGTMRDLKSATQAPELIDQLEENLRHAGSEEQVADVQPKSNTEVQELVQILEGSGATFEPKPVSAHEEVALYFWVEYREAASQSWRGIHPVFTDVPAEFRNLQPEEFFADSIPEKHQQRLSFSVEIEQAMGSKVIPHVVIPPFFLPAASLYGVEFSFTNVPMNFTGDAAPISMQENMDTAEFFIPILSEAGAAGTQVFDLSGNVVPQDAAVDPAAGIFKQIGDKAGSAAAALDAATAGEDAPDIRPRLVGQTIVIQVLVPGRPTREFRKSVVPHGIELYNESGQPTAALKDALAARQTIGFAMGDFPEQYLFTEMLSNLEQTRPLFDAIFASISGFNEQEYWERSRFRDLPVTWGQMASLIHAMHNYNIPRHKVAYFGEPGLIVHRLKWNEDKELEANLDILSNTRQVLELSAGKLRTDPRLQAELGVWDTAVENRFLAKSAPYSSADPPSLPLRAAGSVTEASVAVSGPAHARRWMVRDLAAGFSLFLPEKSASGSPAGVQWWRVNEETGETLGMLADGSGGATMVYPISVSATEYLIMKLVSLTVTAAFAAGGYHDCVQATQEEQCCMELAVGGAVAGGVIGIGVFGYIGFELTIARLFWIEVGINSAVGLYSNLDFWAELCQTAVFGQNESSKIFPYPDKGIPLLAHLFASHEPLSSTTGLNMCTTR